MSSLVHQDIARVQNAVEKVASKNVENPTVTTALHTSTYYNHTFYKVYVCDEAKRKYTFVTQKDNESTKAFIKRSKREITEHFKV